jgi:accessory colonization factor AcfC
MGFLRVVLGVWENSPEKSKKNKNLNFFKNNLIIFEKFKN